MNDGLCCAGSIKGIEGAVYGTDGFCCGGAVTGMGGTFVFIAYGFCCGSRFCCCG